LTHTRALLTHTRALLTHTRALLTHTRALLTHTRALLTHTRALLTHTRALLTPAGAGAGGDGWPLPASYEPVFSKLSLPWKVWSLSLMKFLSAEFRGGRASECPDPAEERKKKKQKDQVFERGVSLRQV
jgi:hypothetical protein